MSNALKFLVNALKFRSMNNALKFLVRSMNNALKFLVKSINE